MKRIHPASLEDLRLELLDAQATLFTFPLGSYTGQQALATAGRLRHEIKETEGAITSLTTSLPTL